jgi:hypothetical protein
VLAKVRCYWSRTFGAEVAMFELQLGQSHLWIVQRRSGRYGVIHVALVEWIPSWSHPDGDRGLSKVIEFSDAKGLTIRALDQSEGWTFIERIDDRLGVRERLAEVVGSKAPYDVVLNNCEHMVWYVATGVRKSPQVRNAAFAVVGMIALVALVRSTSRQIA